MSISHPQVKNNQMRELLHRLLAMKMQNLVSSFDLLCWNIILKGNSAKSMTTDKDGNQKIRPPVTAEEHQQVQREEKARTILLSALLDEHMGDFYHMIDARDIWNAIKARFGYSSSSSTLSNAAFVSTTGSSQGKLSYQELGNDGYGGYTTTLSASPGSSSSKGSSKSKCSVVDDVIYSFFVNHEIDQQLVYEDLDQMNKEEFEEYDLKHQMAMLSIKFDKKLVKCFNCKKMGHFSRECPAQGGRNSNNYQKYKEAAKDGTDSNAMVVVDGMVSADDVIPAVVFVSHGPVVAAAADSPYSETEFAFMGLSTEAHKHAVKSLEKQINCHQTNQLAYEEKIKVLSYELDEKSNILKYRQKLIDQAAQEKQQLMSKLENEITNQGKWNNSGRNLYKLIDSSMSVRTKRGLGLDKYIGEGELVEHMKAVPPPLTGNYMPPSNIPDIDESQMVYGKKATDSSEIKTNDDSISLSHDSVLFDFSDRSSTPFTNDFQTCDSSQECSRPNHIDHDSNDSIFSVSAPASESIDTIVIDCARQEVFPSVCTSSIETDVKSSNTLCNMFGSFNKESHIRKHKSDASKSCYVCGSYLHLIKDCDLHEQRLVKRNAEGKGELGRRPTGKPVNLNRPKPVSADQPNPVFAGQPHTVSAGDRILGPGPLNIQSKSWPWTNYGMSKTMGSKINGGSKSKSWSFAKGPLGRPKLEKAKDKGIVDSGCSQSMSGNKDKLEDFEDFHGGEVTFGGST
uniref:Xylulose kinase-1 n=1 Tax=Tanacetum cinerariifolium TaxID=118510 RepID=A0A6L2KR85_TANCI|nr:xylulose kinase-1 [Tanacetum cinerariifolium]